MNKLNQNSDAGTCICAFSFRYGNDYCDVYIYEHPDLNEGYIAGWIVVIDTAPYFVSAIEEWSGLFDALENLIGHRFGLKYKNPHDDLEGFEDDDFCINLDNRFCEAMHDAGYIQDDEGAWGCKSKRKKAIKSTKKQAIGKKKCRKK